MQGNQGCPTSKEMYLERGKSLKSLWASVTPITGMGPCEFQCPNCWVDKRINGWTDEGMSSGNSDWRMRPGAQQLHSQFPMLLCSWAPGSTMGHTVSSVENWLMYNASDQVLRSQAATMLALLHFQYFPGQCMLCFTWITKVDSGCPI